MRNQFAGTCYRCNTRVEPGDGHFEQFFGRWRVQHASCAIEHRGTPCPAREAINAQHLQARALGTGRKAQRARAKLRKKAQVSS